MRFTLTIDCDNAAFEDAGTESEVARILENIVTTIDAISLRGGPRIIRDINGNTVGRYELS